MNNKIQVWTVSVIAQYDENDNDLKDAYCELESAILAQDMNPNIRYLIFLYNQTRNTAEIKELKQGYYGTVKQLEIIGRIDEGLDFYSGNELVSFLKDHAGAVPEGWRDNMEMRHLVLTWGHASGYGLYYRRIKDKNAASAAALPQDAYPVERKQFLKAQYSIKEAAFSKSASGADEKINVISIKELKRIFSLGLGRVDVLLAMNCYMQTFEAGYELRNVVKLMIAPQTMIPFFGYNYLRLFELLHKNPACDLQTIGKNVCNYFPVKYLEEPFHSKTYVLKEFPLPEYTAFSAILLKGYDEIYDLINNIAQYFLDHQKDIFRKCEHARTNIVSSASSQDLIDFRFFFGELSKLYNEPGLTYPSQLDKYQDELLDLRDKYMVSIRRPGINFEGNNKYISYPYGTSSGAQFFSIFFPYNISKNELETRAVLYGYNDIFRDSKWNEFIMTINELPVMQNSGA